MPRKLRAVICVLAVVFPATAIIGFAPSDQPDVQDAAAAVPVAHSMSDAQETAMWKKELRSTTTVAPTTTTTAPPRPVSHPSRSLTRPVATTAVVVPLSGDGKAFIYNHESGNNPAIHNSDGCRGLGQACPGSKLPCSDHDYACQDSWFTGYMQAHYGTWAKAEAHWKSLATYDARRHDWFGGSW